MVNRINPGLTRGYKPCLKYYETIIIVKVLLGLNQMNHRTKQLFGWLVFVVNRWRLLLVVIQTAAFRCFQFLVRPTCLHGLKTGSLFFL